ncbi:biotin/lipoyl-containing protein [Kocuria oceani]|uniref:biotin/lipoyl-containing protein n=1 Tax=Kocuria oceani TaxID=988827 RepID=UPI0040365CE1
MLLPSLHEGDPGAEDVLTTRSDGDGDDFTEGQPLGEVQVDTVGPEVPAPAAGTIDLQAAEDEVVRRGGPIARLR